MAYIINKFSGEQLIVLEDGTINTSTSLGLVGRNYVGYGETQNENFIFLLENFANTDPPQRPLVGQIWFDSTDNVANVYDGSNWNPIGAAKLSDTAPIDANPGSLWLDTTADQLKIYNGSVWGLVGPEAVANFGITRSRSKALFDPAGIAHAVIFFEINDIVIAILTGEQFTLRDNEIVPGFASSLIKGINLAVGYKIEGDLIGTASSSERLVNSRLINGVPFDGQSNITIKSSTTNSLVKGTYILGSDFDGSSQVTWSVDATSANQLGKIVARNSSGGFAAGTITADLVGNVSGNVTATSGTSRFNVVEATTFVGATLTGNARTASQLAIPRKINEVNFDGTSDVVIASAAGTLTGNTLNATVTQSSLRSVGTLNGLDVTTDGIRIGTNNSLFLSSGTSFGGAINGRETLRLSVTGYSPVSSPQITLLSVGKTIELLGTNPSLNLAAIIPGGSGSRGGTQIDLGADTWEFRHVHAQFFKGTADTATSATTATNLAGGGLGSIPYQTAVGTTAMLGLGAVGTVLTAQAGGLTWAPASREPLTKGSFVSLVNSTTSAALSNYDGIVGATIAVDATSANTVSKIVARDSSGNFSAGTITANLIGSVSGNAGTATSLQTSRTINGVAFNGTSNITITADDPNKVPIAGGSMSGYLTLVANPVNALHAAPKQYVDSVASGLSFPAGMINLWYGSIESIPVGWALCNGSNGTPDLRNRFIVGAGSTYAVGATGGTADAIVVSHAHSINDPKHTHSLTRITSGPWQGTPQGVSQNTSGTDGNLDGSMFVTGYDRSSVPLGIDTASTGISIRTEGVSGNNANLPPYYALCYIMKL